MHYRIIELNGTNQVRIRQQRATARDMPGALHMAEMVLNRPTNSDCRGALIVEDNNGAIYPLLTVTVEREHVIDEHTGEGYLKFIRYRYDDDPVRCFQNYGYRGRMV
jgi:hypothetical protein